MNSTPQVDTLAELAAAQMMLLALINTHPDRKLLLATFDAMVSNLQVFFAQSGGPQTPERLREAIQRYRAQILQEP